MSVRHILTIEDNPADVDLLKLALDNAGVSYTMTVIEDGGEALAYSRVEQTPPDLIVLDLNLPKSDGLEILEAIRANQSLDATPVAVLSSSSSARDRTRIENYRITRFLTKSPYLEEYLAIGDVLKQVMQGSDDSRRAAP